MGLRSKLRSVKLFLEDPSAWADERSHRMNQVYAEHAIETHREARQSAKTSEPAPAKDAKGS